MTKMRRLLSIFLIIGMMATLITGINVNAAETVTAAYELASSTKTTVAVKFSEAVSADAVSGVTLTDCETLTAATISSVTQIDDTTVALNAEGLKYGAEYKLSIPAGITAVSGNTTAALEMYINAYNPTTIVPGGVPKPGDEIIFEEDFDSYTDMASHAGNEQKGWETTADKTKWKIDNVQEWHLGSIITAGNGGMILRSRPKQNTGEVYLDPAALMGEVITSGVTEIYFDAAFCNPESNDEVMQAENSTTPSENYVLISFRKDGVENDYPVIRIDRTDIRMFDNGVYNYLPVNGFANANNVTVFNKYKLIVDMDEKIISLAIYNGNDYEIVQTTPINATTLGKNGFDSVILGHYKTPTNGTVSENTMSAFDNVKIIKKANNDTILLLDDFESYPSYYAYDDTGVDDTAKISSNADFFTSSGSAWTRVNSATGWGFNTYPTSMTINSAAHKVLKLDGWQWGSPQYTSVVSNAIDEPVVKGIVEITYDAAVYNPEANFTSGMDSYFINEVKDGAGVTTSLLKIEPNVADATNAEITNEAHNIYAFTDTETKLAYTNKNEFGAFNSFKIELNYNAGTIDYYIMDNGDYVKTASGKMNTSLLKNGFSQLSFKYQKDYSGGIAYRTGALVDNVCVVVKDVPPIYEFEEDFSDYTAFDASTNTSCGGEAYYVSQLANPKWIRGGWGTWGINSYVALCNGEKVLKQDIFQTTAIGETNVTTTALAEASNTGVAEISFDVAVQDLNETGNNWYFVGLKDGNLGFMPVMKINKTEISVTPAIDDSYSEVIEGYTNANNLTTFNKYKVVLDFDKGTTEFFIMDGSDYVSVAKGTMNETLKARGIKQLVFGYRKGEKSSVAILNTTSALLDNVRFNVTEKRVSAPVVKSVRIDGAAASNTVATTAKSVKIYFNRTMNSKSLSGISINGVDASGSYNKDENSYTLTIKQELNPMKVYTINVPTTATDVEGKPLDRAYAGTFTTKKGDFAITEFSLKEGEEAATYENTAAGDTLTAKVAIKNYAVKTGEYALICAIYDGDILVKTNYVAVPYTAETLITEKTINIVVPETTGKLKVKAMLWDVSGSAMDSAVAPIVLQ